MGRGRGVLTCEGGSNGGGEGGAGSRFKFYFEVKYKGI